MVRERRLPYEREGAPPPAWQRMEEGMVPFEGVVRRVEFRRERWRVGPWKEGMMVELTVRRPPWGA